jgi:hypothetical protein
MQMTILHYLHVFYSHIVGTQPETLCNASESNLFAVVGAAKRVIVTNIKISHNSNLKTSYWQYQLLVSIENNHAPVG